MQKNKLELDKDRAVELAIGQIEKQFGRGSIMKLGDDSMKVEAEVIPTGSLALDHAIGIGGVARGRIVELFGPESSGKTTLALSMVAQAQQQSGYAAYIDAEHALDPDYAKNISKIISYFTIS